MQGIVEKTIYPSLLSSMIASMFRICQIVVKEKIIKLGQFKKYVRTGYFDILINISVLVVCWADVRHEHDMTAESRQESW